MDLVNSQGELTFGNIIEILRNFEDYTSMSLPQYTKRSTINARTFIDRQLADCDILNDLLKTDMNLYTGFIMTALDMNRFVTNTKTARDMMMVVSTESFNYINETAALESLLNPQMLEILPTEPRGPSAGGSKVIDHTLPNVNLPSGRIIEVKFGDTRNSAANSFTVNLFLNIHPTFVPTEVAEAFIDINFTPTFKQRWLQWNVGEISFWKDFILSTDLIKRRANAMRKDRTGVLSDMLKRQQNAVNNAWLKLSLIFNEKQNIANTILVFDKYSFNKVCSRSNLNFDNYGSRQKFFNKTFAMMVNVIDQNYSKVDTYFHGLDIKATYDFKQIKTSSKSEKFDLTEIMKSMSQGSAPRF